MKTLQQHMAVSALDRVKAFKGNATAEAQDKYSTMARKLPVLILSAGLVEALAFVESRGDNAQTRLLDDVAHTVNWPGATSAETLAERSRTAELGEYMLLTRRVIDALTWYKRYAESVLPGEGNTPQQPEGAADAE
jgi:CRISPR-associated protein Cmr5